MTNITILTDARYVNPQPKSEYVSNIILEYEILRDELKGRGLTVDRVAWDDKDYDWSKTRCVVFRTVWDYFERFDAFMAWVDKVKKQTILVNSEALLRWNIDKHYLHDLKEAELDIVPSVFVDKGQFRSLNSVCADKGWQDIVIKPAIGGAAFLTYKVMKSEVDSYEERFSELVAERDMLVQPYIETITSRGEASIMVFNGQYTHAILKKARPGDFRVQDDFGGTVHHYKPSDDEIAFAEAAFAACPELPAYGRVDIVWDEKLKPLLSELEIFEPELWLRFDPDAAKPFVDGILRYLE